MKRCRRCGDTMITAGRICPSCLHDWCNMRTTVFNKLEDIHGKLSTLNIKISQSEMRRLTELYTSDREKFDIEFERLGKKP